MELKFANTDETMIRLADLVGNWATEMGYDCTKEDIKKDLADMAYRGVVLFVEEDGEPVAVMSGLKVWHFWVKNWIAHEHWLFVHPDHRGKKLAKVLISAFSAWGTANKCSHVMLSPNKFGSMNIDSARDGFKKHGYEVHGYQMIRSL